MLPKKTPLEHILGDAEARWTIAIGRIVVTLSRFVDFYAYLLGGRQPLIMLESQLIPRDLPILLDQLLFLVFISFFLYDSIQKSVARGLVHFEDPPGDDARNFVFGNMIEQVPVGVVQVLVFDGSGSVFACIGPFLFAG